MSFKLLQIFNKFYEFHEVIFSIIQRTNHKNAIKYFSLETITLKKDWNILHFYALKSWSRYNFITTYTKSYFTRYCDSLFVSFQSNLYPINMSLSLDSPNGGHLSGTKGETARISRFLNKYYIMLLKVDSCVYKMGSRESDSRDAIR